MKLASSRDGGSVGFVGGGVGESLMGWADCLGVEEVKRRKLYSSSLLSSLLVSSFCVLLASSGGAGAELGEMKS